MPWFAALLVVATLASGLWLCAGNALSRQRWHGRRRAHLLAPATACAAILAVAAFLRYEVATPHLAMFVDEPWYAEAACNLARHGRLDICEERWDGRSCSAFEKAPGWPVTLAFYTALHGCSPTAGITVNRFAGSATPALVWLGAAAAGAAWWQAAIAATAIAIHPVHVEWSVTGETNVTAAAALLLGLCGVLAHRRRATPAAAATAVCALALAAAMRPESLAPALAAGLIAALAPGSDRPHRIALWLAIAATAGVAAGGGASLWDMNRSTSGGMFFSAANLVANAGVIANRHFAPIAICAVAGVALARARGRGAAAAIVAAAAVAGAAVVLAYDRFSPRMLLTAAAAAAPLIACAFDLRPRWLGAAAALLVAALLGHFWAADLTALEVPRATQLVETRIVVAAAAQPLPAGALFIAEQPTVLAAAGFARVMRTGEALRQPQRLTELARSGSPVYFLRDMYCEGDFAAGPSPDRCREIAERFTLTPVVEERLDDRVYGLYALGEPAAPATAPTGLTGAGEPPTMPP